MANFLSNASDISAVVTEQYAESYVLECAELIDRLSPHGGQSLAASSGQPLAAADIVEPPTPLPSQQPSQHDDLSASLPGGWQASVATLVESCVFDIDRAEDGSLYGDSSLDGDSSSSGGNEDRSSVSSMDYSTIGGNDSASIGGPTQISPTWWVAFTPCGLPYYHNVATNETTWDSSGAIAQSFEVSAASL